MLDFEKIEEGIFLARTRSERKWECAGLAVRGNGGCALIDCNFTAGEARQLLEKLGAIPDAYFISHFHLDHANNVKSIEQLGIPVYCPRPEHEFPMDLDRFLVANGSYDYGVAPLMKEFIYNGLGFRELDSVAPFSPGEEFHFGSVRIRTIHAPGHSPGHTVFAVQGGAGREVLFTSDTGLDKMGAWYGFKYCRLDGVRRSILSLERMYGEGDYILASSHGPVYREKNPLAFKEALQKIEATERRLLDLFAPGQELALDDIALRGVYYRKNSVAKLDDFGRKLYFFWESGILINHLEELEEKGLIRRGKCDTWVLNEPAALSR
jgi:glyoxylase-like metal-dependent hydrolase (beta-lactamase superfamily II)